MNKSIYFIISIFILILSCKTMENTNNNFSYKTFNNIRNDISFKYPKDWYVKEEMFNTPYYIFISKEKINSEKDTFKTGITISKMYHQSWVYYLDNNDYDKSFSKIRETQMEELKKYSYFNINSEEIKLINGVQYLIMDISFKINEENVRCYFIYSLYNDVYLSIICESLEEMFNNYKDYYISFLNDSNFFNLDKNKSDNDILDNQCSKISLDLLKIDVTDPNISQYLNLMDLAIKMNPNFAFLYFSRGLYYYKFCQLLDGEKQNEIANMSINDLNKACELFKKYTYNLFNQNQINNALTQSFYSLGEIYLNVIKDKNLGKQYLEKALEIVDDPQIRELYNRL